MTLDSTFPASSPGDQFDVAEMWLSALRAAGRSKNTLSNYRHAVDKLAAFRGHRDVTTLTKFEALRFVQHLQDTYTPGGVANRVRSLKALYGWLVNEELIEASPLRNVKITVTHEAHTTASDDDVDKMLARAKTNKRDHALLTLLVDTGCRKGEVAALTVADIDLTSGTPCTSL